MPGQPGPHMTLASEQELSDFLKSADRRAFKRVCFAVRDEDAALDIVQDAMIRLAESYADRPVAELPMLFQRILSNATLDWFRRQKVRNAHLRNFSDFQDSNPPDSTDRPDLLDFFGANERADSAADELSRFQVMQKIDEAVKNLPARQREAFLLRYWDEMDVSETAAIMGCSEGSVKTHCSRAVGALAQALRKQGIEP